MKSIWRSQGKSGSNHNKDCLGILIKKEFSLYIIVDGSSSTPKGGALAQELQHRVVNGLSNFNNPTSEDVVQLLKDIHIDVRREFAADSASYLTLLNYSNLESFAVFAGDCRLGLFEEDGTITWITQVHSLANAIRELNEEELVGHSSRPVLTRCFKGKRFQNPDTKIVSLPQNKRFVIATDGFWASLSPEEQIIFCAGGMIENFNDDVSALIIQPPFSLSNFEISTDKAENIYQCFVAESERLSIKG